MPLSTRRALMGGGYDQKVLSYNPIAYWPLSETTGTIARCLVNTAQNGTYNSDVSTWPIGVGIGDGNTAPYLDGANDVISIDTAALRAVVNTSLGSAALWARVAAAGIWTDGLNHWAFRLDHNNDNRIDIFKAAANGRLESFHEGNTIASDAQSNGHAATDWIHLAITWNVAANQHYLYVDGVQSAGAGGPVTAWLGALDREMAIGSLNEAGLLFWNGWLAHCAIWNRALSQAEVNSLRVV